MLGATIGDIVGSIHAWNNIKTKKFELFDVRCRFSGATVLTCAVAKALRKYVETAKKCDLQEELKEELLNYGWLYPDINYGRSFMAWLFADEQQPYGSAGAGSAMRVSPAGWLAASLAEAEEFAKMTAEVTHSHAEGIKGAQAVAAAVYLARQKTPKEEIKGYIEEKYYKLDFALKDIRMRYTFNPTCAGTVPPALVAFFEAEDFEDAVRNAVSIGGDSATLAAVAGSVAEAYYGIPENIIKQAMPFLDEEIKKALDF
ncbi:MAG: ADP-ribosylglycohydrolase family protein [Acidaminococcaceae bacterium]